MIIRYISSILDPEHRPATAVTQRQTSLGCRRHRHARGCDLVAILSRESIVLFQCSCQLATLLCSNRTVDSPLSVQVQLSSARPKTRARFSRSCEARSRPDRRTRALTAPGVHKNTYCTLTMDCGRLNVVKVSL